MLFKLLKLHAVIDVENGLPTTLMAAESSKTVTIDSTQADAEAQWVYVGSAKVEPV